jgi:hypothetical protein
MKLISNLKKLSCVALLAINLTACSNNNLINSADFQNDLNTVSATSFRANLFENKVFGKWDSYNLTLGSIVGNQNGYQNQNDMTRLVLDAQNHFLSDSSDYAIVQDNTGRLYSYEIKASSNFLPDAKDLKTYSDLRSAVLSPNLPEAKIICIVSEQGKFRFQNGEPFPQNFGPAATPEQIIGRLTNMQEILAKSQDHRGLFTVMYKVITERAYKELQNYKQQGNMKAAAFEEKLMVNFANKYFEAFDNYSSNNIPGVTEVWRMSFDSGRKSQSIGLHESGNIGEILGLSMNAHIIHDLPLTLKEIGYNVNDPVLKATFDRFNTVLFEEKDNILAAIKKYYGKNVVQDANNFFGPIGNFTMQKIFSIMRGIASNQAAYSDEKMINRTSIAFADGLQQIIPGGNSIIKPL